MAVITLTPKEVGPEMRARARQTPGEVMRAMVRAARFGQALLVRRTPKDRGQAKAGWRVSQPIKGTTRARVDLYNDNPYVGILEEGARPHGVSLEGRIAIYEWVLRNIQPAPVSGPIQAKTGGRRAFQKESTEAVAMDITNAIVWKLRTKGQEGTFFVKDSMDDLRKGFGVEVEKQIKSYARRRAKRGGRT